MITIGLCGTSGSGKGYVCEKFKEHNIEYIDTDKVYSKIAVPESECLKEICMFFGDDVLNDDGTLNKRRLSSRVFEGENAAQRLKLLNRITHKYIRDKVEATLEKYSKKGICWF